MRNKTINVFLLALSISPLFLFGNTSEITKSTNTIISNHSKLVGSNITISKNPSADLTGAQKKGKTVFLIITGTNTTNIEKAINITKEANGKVSKSTIVQINKDDAANSSLVTKLGIANVQTPFILVISPKGVPTAGFPLEKATSDNLVKSIPSPKQDEALLALSEKKPVFFIISKKGFADKKTILTNCKTASAQITSKPVIIDIDIDDNKESAFLKQLGITSINNSTKTVVANASGQLTETFEGTVDVSKLTTSATKIIKSSGCCPGGSSSGCGKK